MRFFPASSSTALIRLFCLIALSTTLLVGQEQQADIIFHNGKILTVDSGFSTAEAVAIGGRQFTAVGRNQQVLQLAGPSTRVIDLKGKTVIPGLIDPHTHFHNYALSAYGGHLTPEQLQRYPVDWRGVTSKEDVLNQIEGLMDKYQFRPGQWVYFENRLSFAGGGGSVNNAKILYDELNRWELDKVTPNNPVVLSIGVPDNNGFLLNSKAVEIIWDERQKAGFIEKYGRYWVDESGRPTGHLEPPASRLVWEFVMNRPPEVFAPVYKRYLEEMASAGVTTASTRMPPESVRAFQLLESRGEMTLRLGYGREEVFGTLEDLKSDLTAYRNVAGTGSDTIWVTSVAPTAVDGATTRACTNQKRLGAYGPIDSWWPSGQCHNDIEFRGAAGKAAPISGNYFREWTINSGLLGVRYANTHVAGDRSVALLLDMVEEVQRQAGPSATKGWALDHCFLVNPADFQRAARLDIAFSCAPKYIERSSLVADAYGEEVAHTFLDPVKSMLEAGIKVSFESDRDVFVWHDLEILMTRKDPDGKQWGLEERVYRVTALKMITRWAADYVLKGDKLGSIEPGRLADLVVLDRDYMTIPEEEVSEIRPRLTMLDGKIIYVHPQFAQEQSLRPAGAVLASYEDLKARRTARSR